MNIVFGLFLIAHGLIHASYVTPKPPVKEGAPAWPFDLSRSWVLSPMGLSTDTIKTIGVVFAVAVILGFFLSGLGWLGVSGLKSVWVPATVASSILSIIMLLLYWHNWLVMGPLIDLALLYLIYYRILRP